jgi:AcrR family transcriptional regulator
MPKAPKKTTEPAGHRPLRADAQRNQQQILTAARDVFVERGTDAPLDEIARRAGVGIGTLYRRFTDRPTLLRAVVVDALTHTRQAAERARTEASDAFAALTAYMHAVLDLRVSAVIPLALDRLDLDDEQLLPLREASAQAAERMVEDAHADGSLPEDVTFGDIGMMLVRLSRPLPGPMSADLDNRLAHRHLDLLIEGLRPRPRRRPPGGPRLARADLHEIGEEEHADVPRAGRAR